MVMFILQWLIYFNRIGKVVDDLEQLREHFESQRAAPSSPQQSVNMSMASLKEPVSLGRSVYCNCINGFMRIYISSDVLEHLFLAN